MHPSDDVLFAQKLVLCLPEVYGGAIKGFAPRRDPLLCICRCHDRNATFHHSGACCSMSWCGKRIREGGMDVHVRDCIVCKKKIIKEALRQSGVGI